MKLRLSPAQVSALECRDYEDAPLREAWRARGPRRSARRCLNDAEDADAARLGERDLARYARRAAASLAALAGKVL